MTLHRRGLCGVLFLLGAFSSLCYFVYGPPPPVSGGSEVFAVAETLATEGRFANPFPTAATGPTAMVPPVYPLFLAALLKLFGSSAPGLVMMTHIGMAGLHTVLLAAVSGPLFGTAAPGMWAAGISILLPLLRIMPAHEAVFAANGVLLFCLVAARMIRRNVKASVAVATGLFAALLLHLNPAVTSIALLWLGFLLWRDRVPFHRWFRFALLFAGVVLLCSLPWILRNRVRLGAPVLTDSFGMNLSSSNNDCAESSLQRQFLRGCHQQVHPGWNSALAQRIPEIGEPGFDRECCEKALRWIHLNRERFVTLTGRRVWEFWFPAAGDGIFAYAVWLVTALSVPGLATLVCGKQPVTAFMVAAWAIYPLPYYVINSELRYRYPVLWISTLCAGFLLWKIQGRFAAGRLC